MYIVCTFVFGSLKSEDRWFRASRFAERKSIAAVQNRSLIEKQKLNQTI